jgi:hypothetical protein
MGVGVLECVLIDPELGRVVEPLVGGDQRVAVVNDGLMRHINVHATRREHRPRGRPWSESTIATPFGGR